MNWDQILLTSYAATMTICWIVSYCLLHDRNEQIKTLESNLEYVRKGRDDALRMRNAVELGSRRSKESHKAKADELADAIGEVNKKSKALFDLINFYS